MLEDRNRTHKVPEGAVHTYNWEYTDTFGGEANYSWVKRGAIEFRWAYSHRQLVCRLKRAIGLTGVRCAIEDNGDTLTIRPSGMHMIAFADCVVTATAPAGGAGTQLPGEVTVNKGNKEEGE